MKHMNLWSYSLVSD